MAIFFGIIGSWGLIRQARAIWRINPDGHRSAESVSGVWVITFLAMFTAFLLYGIQKESFPMTFQGWLRVGFSLPVTAGFMLFGKRNWKHWVLLLVVYPLFLALMSKRDLSPILFTAFSFLGIWASFVQAYTIWQNRSRGKVAVELQTIYLSAIICWLIYGFVRNDYPLIIVSVGFTLSYSTTIWMWVKYPTKAQP